MPEIPADSIRFLERLREKADQEREGRYNAYREYYDGKHDTQISERQRTFLQLKIGEEFNGNYCPLVVDALEEKLTVTGFETADEGAQDIFWDWWKLNRMDHQQGIVHTAAVRDGDSFVTVAWDNDEERPTFTYEAAYNGTEGAMVHYSRDTRKPLFASKRWVDDEDRTADLPDGLFGVVLEATEHARRQPEVDLRRPVGDGGQRRFEDESPGPMFRREVRRDRTAQRPTMNEDLFRRNPFHVRQVPPGGFGVEGGPFLARLPFAPAVAAVVDDARAQPEGVEDPDGVESVGDIAGVPVTEDDHAPGVVGRDEPGVELDAVRRLEEDVVVEQSRVGGRCVHRPRRMVEDFPLEGESENAESRVDAYPHGNPLEENPADCPSRSAHRSFSGPPAPSVLRNAVSAS